MSAVHPTTTLNDSDYTKPYLDVDEWRDEPVRHRYVHGGFEGTDLRFSYYFPPEEQYAGRFFQPILAVSGTEHAFGSSIRPGMGGSIAFAVDSGAYLVESNLGSLTPYPGEDGTVTGYRASAAAAQYSRILAAEMYGEHRPFGYCYGGSGGGFKTMSCMENTDVWDGGVPFIIGSPMALPNVFAVQAHAMRILWEKFPQIVDALDPGGSGDMYAGLSAEEREALEEVTRMGFPPRAWFDVRRIAQGYTGVWSMLGNNMMKYDPTYFEDFWNVPGYLGANPPESLLQARIQHKTTVIKPIMADEAGEYALDTGVAIFRTEAMADIPIALKLEGLPEGSLMGAMLSMTSGNAAGHNFWIISAHDDIVVTGQGETEFRALSGVGAGDEVLIDNSVYLAFQTYHRHQVHPDFRVWDQFCVAGQPVYPQRPNVIGPQFSFPGAGSVQSGRFSGKVIVVECLMDEAAYPWQAAWYDELVHKVQPHADDKFRLWYVDNAMHMPPQAAPDDPRPVRTTRIVSYGGVLEQALRDLSAWVEKGMAPPASTTYQVIDGQVFVPGEASERKGVQSTVEVTANGRARADVAVGEEVHFAALVEAPPGTGTVVSAEWDFDGSGEFTVSSSVLDGSCNLLNVTATHTFTEPGTYFPALRVRTQRHSDTRKPHARIENLGRVRVVVE
jgi:PKD domain